MRNAPADVGWGEMLPPFGASGVSVRFLCHTLGMIWVRLAAGLGRHDPDSALKFDEVTFLYIRASARRVVTSLILGFFLIRNFPW